MQTEAIFENIAERILQEISSAEQSVFIAVAWFTNKNIFDLLLQKAKHGCKVSVMVSKDEINENSYVDFERLNFGMSKVYKVGDRETKLMHNKFCVIDHNTVITGSYNWSYKAETNFENIVVTKGDTVLAEQFVKEFENIRTKFYPDSPKEEVDFPLNKIIKRLEILKNYIVLEDVEELDRETQKLKIYNFNDDLSEIINYVLTEEYSHAIRCIERFISKNIQLSVWTDPEIVALKLEIKLIEHQLNAFDNEKSELEKILSEFQHRHTKELGEVILEILRLRKLKFKSDDQKFEEAEQDEQDYRKQFDSESKKEIYSLTEEQKCELKSNFRKAALLCHPDKVSEEFEIAAQRIFMDLKAAYDSNDLKTVNEIFKDLDKGNFFRTKSETVKEKDLLRAEISKMKRLINQIETEIITIKESETYNIIISIKDWDEYFSRTKKQLEEELDMLKGDNTLFAN
jgi:hypothetical protein